MEKRPIPIFLSDGTIGFGGARVCFKDMLGALDKDAFEVHALMREHAVEFDGLPRVDMRLYPYVLQFETGQRLRALKFMPGKVATLLSYPLHAVFQFLPYFLFLFFFCLRRRVRIVHLNNQLLSNLPALLAARILRIKVISHQREFPDPRKAAKNRLCDSMIHRHIAVSGSIKEALVRCGIAPEKIEVIHDAIDIEKLKSPLAPGARRPELEPGRKHLGMFGRIVEWKGQLQVIKAVEGVVERHPELKLYIVGDTSDAKDGYMAQCLEYVRAHKLEKWIEFTGYMSAPHTFMGLMDIVVHNSTSPEPFGMVVAEGMALRKVVMAARLGGPPEIIEDGVNGCLVDPHDLSEIRRKLGDLLDRLPKLDAMREAAYLTVLEKFNLRTQVIKVEKLYRSLLK